MTKRPLPPVPPAGRSDKPPGAAGRRQPAAERGDAAPSEPNPDRGDDKNIAVNTTNQGYQQDR
ncbi:MAG: hypothetical protein JO258_17680 [Alphaproteobacteria bacterium]|nr:hypothetical protein [Alphaproteobacteria bacterium]